MKLQEQHLPDDLQKALHAKTAINTVYGTFIHRNPTDTRIPIFVRSSKGRTELDRQNPDKFLTGIYCCFGIAPLNIPASSDIDGIPIWIPNLTRYGCWNDDTLELFLYPKRTTWSQIEKDLPYFTSFRNIDRGDDSFINMLSINKLYNHFDFIPDDLPLFLENIDAMLPSQKLGPLAELTDYISPILMRYPFSQELIDTYPLLCEMYQKMAQIGYQPSGEPDQREYALRTIEWYEKCVPIIDCYIKTELPLPATLTTILLLLGLWYIDIDNFDKAMEYAEKYKAHYPDGSGAYEEIHFLIAAKKKESIRP